MSVLDQLTAHLREAGRALGDGANGARLERPPQPDFGDYSTNAALLLAPALSRTPRDVAADLGEELQSRLGDRLARVEVAGPGFLNIFLADAWFADALAAILQAGESWGGGGAETAERIDVEFVSANPTGPLTVAHGRHAAFGDALARTLAFHGHSVTREFYVNDYGSQVRRLGESVVALARGEPVAEDGYHGDYVAALVPAERVAALDVDAVAREAADACLEQIRATLERFRVSFDFWFSEHSLYEDGAVGSVLALLDERGDTYRSEDALWLRTSAHGDDKDRVLERSTGEPTYFAADIAFHREKLRRGSDRLIDVWGADHHGYVPRLRAAFEALGGAPDALEVLILQFVHLLDRGARAAMSKRAGVIVTLDQLIEEIGVDAARFFLLARSHDTTVEIDLELAASESNDNPVYYVQYAHARIASILARADVEPSALPEAGVALHASERALLKALLAFPQEVADASARRAPHRIAGYALTLAQEFTAFYRDCRVVGGENDGFRLGLSLAAQRAIARSLDLLGVTAPESM